MREVGEGISHTGSERNPRMLGAWEEWTGLQDR
jgi:hypothetical protein